MMHKDMKNLSDEETALDIEKMWRISRKYQRKWLHYSALFRGFKDLETNLTVRAEKEHFLKERKKNPAVGTLGYFQRFLKELEKDGLITALDCQAGRCHFTYKNETIKNYFWDGGSILEMYTFTKLC